LTAVTDTMVDPPRVAEVGDAASELISIRGGLTDELAQLGRELDEISMLAQQAAGEAERHESRRVKADERVSQLEREPRQDANELREARSQQLTLTRRATLFEAQQQVLEGKQRTLTRYRDRIAQLDGQLAVLDPSGLTTNPVANAPATAPSVNVERAAILRAQEELRREIARQMHDGPAQSLANIALQAEIVQRMVVRSDPRVQSELEALRTMVQHALDATKGFIFDVRPMVLDDLGIVPTLRRTAVDRSRRSGVEVEFISQGQDRRLAADLESGVFRLVDDLMGAYLALRPLRLAVQLDWTERELAVRVQTDWPAAARPEPTAAQGTEHALRDDLPPALRAMIEETRTDEQLAAVATTSLAPGLVSELEQRARGLGLTMSVVDDGSSVELMVPLPA
jgi:two-component system sensor histidine kinase DegS